MARKKRHAEHVNHERWLVSYADFITLLFAFFVVMFAASNSDQKKAGRIAKAVQSAFNEMAIFDPGSRFVPISQNDGTADSTQAIIAKLVESGRNGEGGRPPMSQVRSQLEALLKEELANRSIRLSEDARGLTISLAEAGFFPSGSAAMPPEALKVVDRIAATLLPLNYGVRVEGHTDNTPIHTAQFPSNWELSTARATFLLQYLIASAKFPAPRLSAVGYGEHRPVGPNNTTEGRAANRRVDLVVIGDAAQKLEPKIR